MPSPPPDIEFAPNRLAPGHGFGRDPVTGVGWCECGGWQDPAPGTAAGFLAYSAHVQAVVYGPPVSERPWWRRVWWWLSGR